MGALYVLPSDTQVDLSVINLTDRYRTYPNGVAGDTILQIITHAGEPQMTLLEDAALRIDVSIGVNFGSNPVPEAVLELVIANSYDGELFGNSAAIDPDFGAAITISATSGVITWPAGTYFDGSFVYSQKGAGPWDNLNIGQVSIGFHVVEAGVGP
jgi:hypothetical protein